ncbi:MAG: FliH/SctL family protein [Fimbriimonadales bacterium]|nr:FliH/SctL family protein [Fimbriimonadales bacterium]
MSRRAILPGEAVVAAKPFLSVLTDPLQAAASQKGSRLHHQLERLREAARREGYEEGLRRGLDEGREAGYREGFEKAVADVRAREQAALEEFVAGLRQLEDCFGPLLDRFFANCEEALAPLAMAVAARLVARELSMGPEAALALAREALAEVTHADSARIRVHPLHSRALRERAADLLAVSESLKRIEFVDDPSIEGGVIVDSAGGVIDASLPTRVRNLVRAVLGEGFLPKEAEGDEAVAA